MKLKKTLASIALAGALTFGGAPKAKADGWYFNDFENPNNSLTEWSNPKTDITPGTNYHAPDRFLGQYGNGPITLTLTNLPTHNSISVAFDLYAIRTWDGNGPYSGDDIWGLVADGQILLNTTFSNMEIANPTQAYPNNYSLETNSARAGASENNTLGFLYGDEVIDSVYNFPNQYHNFTFSHSGSNLTLTFYGGENLQGINDESWGLDNVRIRNGVIPEPSSIALLGAGGLVGLLAGKRKKKFS